MSDTARSKNPTGPEDTMTEGLARLRGCELGLSVRAFKHWPKLRENAHQRLTERLKAAGCTPETITIEDPLFVHTYTQEDGTIIEEHYAVGATGQVPE